MANENETEEVETLDLIECDREKCPQRVETRLNGLGFPYLHASCFRCGKTKVFERNTQEFKLHSSIDVPGDEAETEVEETDEEPSQ